MTVRAITGNIVDLAGVSIPNATFSLLPETYAFGTTASEAIFGDQVTVLSDGSGNVSFDLHEGRYIGRISTTQGPKTFRLVVDSDGPWTLGRLIDASIGEITPTLIQQAFDLVESALSAYQGRQYDTRAEFAAATAYVNGADAPADGTVVTAGGLQYVRKAGDTTLSTSGLPGWLPFGDADYLGHWGIPRHGSEAAALAEGAVMTSAQRTARQAILTTIFGGRTGRLVLDGWVEAFDLIQANPNRVIDTAGSLNFGGAGLAFSSRFNMAASDCFVNGTLVRGSHIKAMRMAFDMPLTGGRADLIQYPTAFALRGDFGKVDHLMITRAWDGIKDSSGTIANNGGTTLGLIQISAFNRPWEFDGDLHHVFVTGAIDVWTFGLNANQQAIMQDGNTLPSRIGRVDVFSAASLSTFKNGGFDIDGEPVAGVGSIPIMIDKMKLDGDRSSLILRSGKSMISQVYATELVANPQYANKILCLGGSHTVDMTDSVGDALATVEVTGGELTMINPRLRNENVTLGKGGEVSDTGKLYLHSPRFVWPTDTQMLRNGDFATDFIVDGTWTRNNVGGAGIPNPAYWDAGEAVLPYTDADEHSGIAQVVGNLADQTYDLIIDLTNSTRDVRLFYAGQVVTLAFGAVRTATLTPTTTNSTFILRGGPTGTGDARISSISYRRTQSRYVPFVEQVGADAVLQVYDPIFDNSVTEPGIAVKFGADNRNNVLRAENCDPARFEFTPAWPLGWYKAGEVGSVRVSDVSRADMVTAIAGGFVPVDGKTYTLDGLAYLGETGATAIADLPGLVPSGIIMFEHGGAGMGAADDSNAIQGILDYAATLGFAMVSGLADEYPVQAVRSCDLVGRLGNLHISNGVHLYGKFKIKKTTTNLSSRGVLWVNQASSGSIRGIEVDVNDAGISTPTVHGIFKNRNLENYTISDVTVRNSSAYGVGMQDDDGTNPVAYTRNCTFENIKIINSGNDGWDTKDSSELTGGNNYTNITVDGFALDTSVSGRVGAHIRGRADIIKGIRVINAGPAALRGIALQTTDVARATTARTTLNGFYVDVSATAGAQGFIIQQPFSKVSDGNVFVSTGNGVLIDAPDVAISNVYAKASGVGGTGFRSVTADHVRLRMSNCTADSFTTNYDIRGPNSSAANCSSLGSLTRGVRIDASATGFNWVGGSITIATGEKVGDFSGEAIFTNLTGFKNRAKLIQTFNVSTTGVKTLTFTHGLDLTPAVLDCQAALGTNNIDDYTLAYGPLVQSVTSTTVTVKVRVISASASANRTASVILHVNSVRPG